VLWIRSDRTRNADPSPELFEPTDCENFFAAAASAAGTRSAEAKNFSQADLEIALQQVNVKYVSDHAQLVALLANVHLMQPRPSAILIDEAELICGGSSSNGLIEVSALLANSVAVSNKAFFALSLAVGSAHTSTARLAHLFDQRLDVSLDLDGCTWSIQAVPHGSFFASTTLSSASMVRFRRKPGQDEDMRTFNPKWCWTHH